MNNRSIDEYGRENLSKRVESGNQLLALAWCPHTLADEDHENAAGDAISNIITALYGPAGTYDSNGNLTPNPLALNEARRLVEHALRSWEGDAEDYQEEASR